jgi:hypothetical protein
MRRKRAPMTVGTCGMVWRVQIGSGEMWTDLEQVRTFTLDLLPRPN